MTAHNSSSPVFIPLSQISIRSPVNRRAAIVDDVPTEPQPASGLSPLDVRLRMLLVDSLDGQSYVFDPESANLTYVSDNLATILTKWQKGGPVASQVKETLADMLHLPEPEIDSGASAWGLKLHLNHACNLACTYCYADGRTSDLDGDAKGAYGGPVTFMRPTIIELAADTFMRDAPGDLVTIIFFGGEPLLAEGRFLQAVDLVKAVAARRHKQVQFTMTTNATLLTDRILDCLTENSFRVAVSVDGTKETHDRQRPTGRGVGSYDAAVEGLRRLSQRGIPAAVRMTAFRQEKGLAENHLALAELPAVTSSFQFSFYGEDASRPMSNEERHVLFEHYLSVARAILRGDRKAAKLGTVGQVIASIVFKKKRQFQCTAGRQFWAVAASGEVFPCHRFVGMSSYALGTVTNPEFRFAPLKTFEENSVRNRVLKSDGLSNCAICFAHNVCGGGCAQIAAANVGRIGELPPFYCQDTRLRLQAVLRAMVEATRTSPTT